MNVKGGRSEDVWEKKRKVSRRGCKYQSGDEKKRIGVCEMLDRAMSGYG